MNIWNWIHILAAYLIYIFIAVLTSIIVSKISGDLKEFYFTTGSFARRSGELNRHVCDSLPAGLLG